MFVILLGVLLSLGQCLTLGPVNAEALRRGLRSGFRPALAVELGSCLGDGLWAALAFAGLGALLGAALLGYLAVQGWREAAPVAVDPVRLAEKSSRLPSFWAGMILSVVNPGSAAFWIGVGATVLASHLVVVGPISFVQFALGYYLALVAWSLGFAALAWQMGRRLPTGAQLWVQRAVALFLGALACFSLYNAVRS